MKYFRYFPKDFYRYGNEGLPDYVQNLSIYVNILDQAKNNISLYNDYYILEGERPDQVSYKLYDTPNYHWSFLIMNDKIREKGWPLTNSQVTTKAQKDFPSTILKTYSPMIVDGESILKIGETIENIEQSKTAVITGRDVNMGHLKIRPITGSFREEDIVRVVGTEPTIVVDSVVEEYNSIKYYLDQNDNQIGLGIDPETGGLVPPGALVTPFTYLDYYRIQNDDLRQIRIIKPELIVEIVSLFREALKS